jgi:hypothetical protein
MRKLFVLAIIAWVAVLCCGLRAYGQVTGSFLGTVTDKSGAAITGATVRVTSQETGVSRQGVTDSTGHYVIDLLPVSVYMIHVEYKGFQPVESRNVSLKVNEQRELDFTLSPATVVSSVKVVASQVAVNTTNASLGQVITSQQVSQLPLNGGDFVQLATLTTGATQESNPNSFFTSGADSEVAARGTFSLSVGGSRPNSTDWLLDGVDDNELTAGGIAIFSSIDSIREFKVLTYNYSAEYGTRAGPTVLLMTKSGTNKYHGSLYEFLRNTSLDARSFFAAKAEKFNLNQFGGSVGGPIRKNKTFFFVDGEQKYQRHGIAFTGLLPSAAMRAGDFTNDPFGNPVFGTYQATATSSPVQVPIITNPNMLGASLDPTVYPNVYFQCDGSGNPMPVNANGSQPQGTPCAKIPGANPSNASTLPNGLINPIGQAMEGLYPPTNANNAAAGINFVSQPVRSLDETKFDIRLDNTFSSADSVFARFSYDQANSYVPGGAPGFAEAGAFGSNQGIINHARNIGIGETHVFSPSAVNQFLVGYNRIFDYITSQGTGSCAAAKLGIIGANLGCNSSNTCIPGAYSCGLTSTLMLGGFWSLGDRGYSPFQGGTDIYTVEDSLDLIRGPHDIHVGIDLRANQMNVGTEAFQDGFWIPGAIGNFSGYATPQATFPSLSIPGSPEADFLMGLVGVAEHDQTFNGPVTGRRWKIFRPYVQDDWRVTNDLTLNLGLAWDLTSPITEAANRMANFDLVTGQLLVAGQNGVSHSAGVQRNWTAFEPRLGLAWKLFGSDKTALRAGYGIFHDSAWSMGAQGLWQNPPFFAESDAFGLAEQSGIPGAGCPFATSYCATVLGNTFISGASINGFPIISTPPTLATFTGTLFTQPTNFKLGKVQQYNVNVERQLPGNVVLTVGYAGSQGEHILVFGNDINTAGPTNCSVGTIGCNANGTPFVPNYGVSNAILLFGDLGQTTYNSLQIKAETKSPKNGLYALLGYTYSRTYDNGLSDGLGSVLSAPYFPLPNWPHLDWALSQINLNNNFTASTIYNLPFGKGRRFGSNWNSATDSVLGGWQVTLIETIHSGFPDPLIDSVNQSGVSFNNGGNANNYNRPNQISDPNRAGIVPANPNPGCQKLVSQGGLAPDSLSDSGYPFNPCAFAVPAAGFLGNANRVPVSGPGFINTDFSAIKQINLPWEGTGLSFRAEFFNLFNHPQFGLPVNDISAAGFGAVNSTVNNPRLIQFGLKLTF